LDRISGSDHGAVFFVCEQGGIRKKLLTAIDARVAYGVDGDNACLPTVDKIVAAVEELHDNY
jgi:hypothetical protein